MMYFNTRAPNKQYMGIGRICNFRPIPRYISTSLSRRRQTRTTRTSGTANVLQTNVDAQCGKHVNELS